MGRAKEIIVKVIPSKIANEFVKKHHYSGKIVNLSNLHFFLIQLVRNPILPCGTKQLAILIFLE